MVTEFSVIFSVVALPLTYLPILLVANDRAYMGDTRTASSPMRFGVFYLVVVIVIVARRGPAADPHQHGAGMSEEIDLGLGILDHQLVDSEGRRCGKVDDLELEGVRDGAPRVVAILIGPPAGRTWPARPADGPARFGGRSVLDPWGEVETINSACACASGRGATARARRRSRAPDRGADPGERAVRLSDLSGSGADGVGERARPGVRSPRRADGQVAEGDRPRVGQLGLSSGSVSLRRPGASVRTRDAMPWTDVVRADRRGVVVREGARPKQR